MPYVQNPSLRDNISQILSGTDLNIGRTNIALVEELSYRPLPAFDSLAGLDTNASQYFPPSATGIRLWRGWLTVDATMTTLYAEGTSANLGGGIIRLYLNGTPVASTTAADWQMSISLAGYAGQTVLIAVRLEGTYTAGTPDTPLSSATRATTTGVYALVPNPAWTLPPVIGTTFDSVSIAPLWTAAYQLYERIRRIPIVGQRRPRYALGPFADPSQKPAHGDYPIYAGGIGRANSADRLRYTGQLINPTCPQIRVVMNLRNVGTVAQSAVLGPGTHPIDLVGSLSGLSVGQRQAISIMAQVVSAGPNAAWQQTRLDTHSVGIDLTSPYVMSTLPPAFPQDLSLIAAETVRDRLNALRTILLDTRARMDATPSVWQRVYATRTWYAKDDFDTGPLMARAPMAFTRRGSRLVVTGKGVTLTWGPRTIPTKDGRQDYDAWTASQSQQLIPGDATQTVTVWLDTIPGLEYTMDYALTGEVNWAGEYDA